MEAINLCGMIAWVALFYRMSKKLNERMKEYEKLIRQPQTFSSGDGDL